MKRSINTYAIFLFGILLSGFLMKKGNEILYYLPWKVTENIQSELFKEEISENFVCLFNTKADTTDLLFVKIDSNETDALNQLSLNSGRKIIIGHKKIPIIFNSDFKFSSIFNVLNNDSSFNTYRYNLIGYHVRFRGSFTTGNLLLAEWDR
jgi:hypothetical protein